MDTRDKSETVSLLYLEYSDYIYQYFKRRLHNEHVAEELMQETFLKLLERGAIEDIPSGSQKRYLQICAKNNLMDYYARANRKEKVIPELQCIEKAKRDFERSLEQIYIRGEVISCLYDVMQNELPDTHRDIVHRKFICKQNIRTISRAVQLSRYKIQKVIQSASLKIRESVAPYYLE